MAIINIKINGRTHRLETLPPGTIFMHESEFFMVLNQGNPGVQWNPSGVGFVTVQLESGKMEILSVDTLVEPLSETTEVTLKNNRLPALREGDAREE